MSAPRQAGPEASWIDRTLAKAVSGPPGRLLAFVVDFAAALLRAARSRLSGRDAD